MSGVGDGQHRVILMPGGAIQHRDDDDLAETPTADWHRGYFLDAVRREKMAASNQLTMKQYTH